MVDHSSFLSRLPPIAIAVWSELGPSYRVLDPDVDDERDWQISGDSVDILLPSGEVCQNALPPNTAPRPFLLEKCKSLLTARGRKGFHGVPKFAVPIPTGHIVVHTFPSDAGASAIQVVLPSGERDPSGIRVKTKAERVRLVARESAETLLVRDVFCLAEEDECEFEVYAGRFTADGPLDVCVVEAPSLAAAYFRYVQVGLLQGAAATGRRILSELAKSTLRPAPNAILAGAVYCSTLGTRSDIDSYMEMVPRLHSAVRSVYAVRELELLQIILRHKARGAQIDELDLKELLRVSPVDLPIVSSTLFDVRDILARSTARVGKSADQIHWIDRYFDWSTDLDMNGPEISFRSQSWEQPSIRNRENFDAWSEAKKKSADIG